MEGAKEVGWKIGATIDVISDETERCGCDEQNAVFFLVAIESGADGRPASSRERFLGAIGLYLSG